MATNGGASASRPGGNFPAAGGAYATASDGSVMNSAMVQNSGGGQPHENRQPYLGLSFCIAIEGIFPSRN